LVNVPPLGVPLGMEDLTIGNSNITASSGSGSAREARLHNSAAWCSDGGDSEPYLQIDLLSNHVLCAVATQGHPVLDYRITSYKISFSEDGEAFSAYKEYQKEVILYGNSDNNYVTKNVLREYPVARRVRILPLSSHGQACLRIELYGISIQEGIFS
ncbi:predicted protein, partial [Nematostella vectensis]